MCICIWLVTAFRYIYAYRSGNIDLYIITNVGTDYM